MRVEKLELAGFKSFADRTVFNLHAGVTCIVGPNGCGKSNIVDAFKWVLGEQSAKSLRGDKMEEVIFDGSQTKKPKGMSEVSLYVSGLGEPENGGKSRLTTVSRRLYRSGDSDYMLNRNICRLKDIRDIFLDTGLEVKSYSIMEQDRIAAILNAKPEDRRFLIEEVAGVVKYKVRRNEARLKLESSRLNLQRVNDIITEIKRQLNSLDRLARKAERYKRFLEELGAIELRLAKQDFDSLGATLSGLLGELDTLRAEDARLRAEITRNEADLEGRRLSLLDKEKQLEQKQTRLSDMEKGVAETERRLAVVKTEATSLKDYSEKLVEQQREVREKITATEQRKVEIHGLAQSIEAEAAALQEELKAQNESIGLKEGELSEKELLLDQKRKQAFDVSEGISTLRNEINMHEKTIEDLAKKETALGAEHTGAGQELKVAEEALAAARASAEAKTVVLNTLQSQKESLEKELSEQRDRAEALAARIASEREELASDTSRLESLREMLGSGAEGELGGNGLDPLTSVSEAIEVQDKYELAVESALGVAVGGLIFPSTQNVQEAATAIRDKDVGRTALIALTSARAVDTLPPPPTGEGILGRASDMVTVREGFAAPVKALLENVLIVADLDTALAISNTKGYTIATLAGEVVEPSGAVIAGKGRDLLKKKRQIRELEAGIEGKKKTIADLGLQAEDAKRMAEEKSRALEGVAEAALQTQREIEGLGHKAQALSDEAERIQRKISNIALELEEARKDKEPLRAGITQKHEALSRAEEQKNATSSEISDIQGSMAQQRASYERHRTETVDIRLKLTTKKERASSLTNEAQAAEALLAELSDKVVFLEKEQTGTKTGIAQKEAEHAQTEGLLNEAVLKADAAKTAIAAHRDQMSVESESATGLEKTLKELRTGLDSVTANVSELDVSKTEYAMRVENLVDNIRGNYGVELAQVQAEPPQPEDQERLEVLRKKVSDIGPVSLGTIEEYEELKQRYDFLCKQRDDIVQSIAELEEAISRINSTTKKKLRDAYEALKEKFSEIFVQLFGGGMAELKLTDESDILETGIDIVAQPPGKKLQNIKLLSGGEKALTALCILFASFLIKPTPLCILDEADSALDEANTEKFAQMLKQLSTDIQFVVITHNKVTMEAADYIYGITMEEPGTSKVISIEMAKA